MKNFLFSIVAFFAFQSSIMAQIPADANSKIPLDPKIRYGKLENGMTYYIRKNSKPENRAELRLAVNAGATMENDDQQGLAHFCEHMAFNGTKNFKKNELINYLESVGTKFGAHLNAYTSFDETVYMLQIPTDTASVFLKGFQILEDWAHNLSFDPEEIDKERGVVVSEWRLGQGAFERMQNQYWPIFFKDSRYAIRLPIGKKEILENCKYETLKQFYLDWYRPENMAVMVIGDIDLDNVEALIKKQFSGIPKTVAGKPVQTYAVPDFKEMRIAKAKDKEAPYTMIQLNYMHPAEHIETYADYRKNLVYTLYTGMMSERYEELQKQTASPFSFAYCYFGNFVRSKNGFSNFAMVTDKNIELGLKTLISENERVKRFGFTAGELERQKTQLMRRTEKSFNEREKTESRNYTWEYVNNFLKGDAIPGIELKNELDKKYLSGISLDEVNALGKKWISDGENLVIIIQSPDKEGVIVPSDEKIKLIFNEAKSDKSLKAYVDDVKTVPLISKKPTPSLVIEEKQIKELGITELKLANGAKIILKPTDFKNDEIRFSTFSSGGYSMTAEKDHLSAQFAADIIFSSGVGDYDPIQLQKLLSTKIIQIYPMLDEVNEKMAGSTTPQDLETMMQLVYLYFTAPRKDSVGFSSFMSQMKGFLENRNTDPESIFQDTVDCTMSGYNFRSKPITAARFGEVDLQKAYSIYKDRFSDASDFTFCFVGNFKTDDIKPLLETYIGGIPSQNRNETCKDIGNKTPKGVVNKIVKKGIEPKSTVQFDFTGPYVWSHKNGNDMNMLIKLASTKLRESLREDKGGVYHIDIRPDLSHYPKESYAIIVEFGCAPEKVEELKKAVMDVIASIKKDGASEIDLKKIKETFRREREVNLKENRFWERTIVDMNMNKENYLELLQFDNYLASLTSEDFKRLANQYFNTNNFATFVLVPEK